MAKRRTPSASQKIRKLKKGSAASSRKSVDKKKDNKKPRVKTPAPQGKSAKPAINSNSKQHLPAASARPLVSSRLKQPPIVGLGASAGKARRGRRGGARPTKPPEEASDRKAFSEPPGPPISKDDIERVRKELHGRTGHDFSSYKAGTITRRVQRRMAIRDIKSAGDYALLVRDDASEAAALFRDLLVGVTEFFRDPESWNVLRDLVIDPLILEKPPDQPLRIWSPGCATGQEAYSIAMLLTERMEALKRHRDVKIFATDINDAAIDAARLGVFPEDTIAKLAPERLDRFFTRGGTGGHQISKQVRNMLVFAQQSLIADPPFSRLDLLSCRNVLIYLEPAVQRKVLTLFCHALRPGGFLFLGNTESIGQFEDLLRPVSKKWRIFQRIGLSRRESPGFPPAPPAVFEDQLIAKRRRRAAPEKRSEEDSLVRQLEQDLKATRDDLQSHLEEFETSNEELKAANEEMMPMNEELQSANEELETSKDELQSLNEELTTLNSQLNSKVEELEATNNDLENLLASTDLATIFLDRGFRIRRFTPAIRQLMNLLPSDLGRPITDFARRVRDERLLADAQRVLETLAPTQAEVRSEEGRVYVRRILPYRTDDGRIDGVVITFNNVSDRKIAERQQAHLAAIVASSEDAILSKDLSGKILTWNASAERLFGYAAAEIIGKPVATIIPPDRLDEETRIFDKMRRRESVHVETTRLTKSGEAVPVALSISPVLGPDGEVMAASTIARDISERRDAERHQQMLVAELDHRVKNTLAVVLSIASQTLQRAADLKEFGPAFEGRIFALAQAHTLLSRGKWKGGSLRELIEQIVVAVEGDNERCLFEGQDVTVPPRVAIALAIVLNELATNAMKHGALRNGGNVRIDWADRRHDDSTTLEVRWIENGGEPISPPETFGYGSQLITMCVKHDLCGEIEMDYQPGGLQCRLRVKWAEGWGGF